MLFFLQVLFSVALTRVVIEAYANLFPLPYL